MARFKPGLQLSAPFAFHRFNSTGNSLSNWPFVRRAEMTMLTEFSIDTATVGAGLAGLDCAALPGTPTALGASFTLAAPFSQTREPELECESEAGPWIECLDGSASLRMRDPRLFAPGREAFCRALLEAAVTQGACRRAEISLELGSCCLDFAPGHIDRVQVAERASAAIRAATPSLGSRGHYIGPGEPSWTSLFAFATEEQLRASIWETRLEDPGRLRLRNRSQFGRRVIMRSAGILAMWPGVSVSDCRPSPWGHELDVEFNPLALTPGNVALASEAALRVASVCENRLTEIDSDRMPGTTDEFPSGTSRDVLVAAGSLVLSVAGLVLPGIPSVPFFLLSCDALGRACPQMWHWLLSIPGLGQILRASTLHEINWNDPNVVAKTVMLGALVAAFFLVLHPPLPLVLACELGMMFISIQ
jgi:uncharacterized membrane protein YbaN (DUF454 family)